jgi:hypothetical protein
LVRSTGHKAPRCVLNIMGERECPSAAKNTRFRGAFTVVSVYLSDGLDFIVLRKCYIFLHFDF